MRRTLQPLLAVAGLSVLLAACSGESPTGPKPPSDGGNGGGTCAVTISLDATSVTPMAGTAVILRATVRKSGAAVPDGTSVTFTTDFGFFLETGLPSVSKVTQNGFADVTLGATSSGLAKTRATFECGSAEKSVEYQPVPANGPFVSSISPTSGTCAGGDTVTINGGRFGTSSAAIQVLFGGRPATVQSVGDTRISVLTPSRTLANPQVPEAVDVTIRFYAGDIPTDSVNVAKGFTYYCVDPNKRMTISAVNPTSGPPDGGQQVTITGNNFSPGGTASPATTRVTFGGTVASVVTVGNTQIVAITPRHILANPAVPETVDLSVTIDLGLVSQQSAVLPQAYTYRAGGSAGQCYGTPGLFIATVQPEDPAIDAEGSPDGGDVVIIQGGGFTAGGTSTTAARTAVFFGGTQAVVLENPTDTLIKVSTPRRVLASPDRPETVDVKVIVDAGGPKEACVQASAAYTYYPGGYFTPIITSISPSSGPNDISTRVTMFGRNFKLPMQVFVGTVEASVVEIKPTQIIFLTPIATGPNSFLAGTTAAVTVRDPYSANPGTPITSPIPFRYYACPSINSVVPATAPWNQSTVVTIAGQNFEEPVEITAMVGNLQIRPSVTSVSSSLITLVMPAIDPSIGAATACADVPVDLTVLFPSVTCSPGTGLPAGFTYTVNPMTATSASPTQLNQAGGPFGSPLSGIPATITVSGSGFVDPMTVDLIKNGAVVGNTTVNNALVANAGQLSFMAPAIPESQLNEQLCIPAGGTTLTGVKWVPTSFGIRLTNARTGCTVDLPNVLIYNPANPACRAPIVLTGTPDTTATVCQSYGPTTYVVSGGVGPYTVQVTGPGNGASGIIYSGAGVSTPPPTVTFSATTFFNNANGNTLPSYSLPTYNVLVTDSMATSGSASFTVAVTDPFLPFTAAAGTTTLDAIALSAFETTTIAATAGGNGAVACSPQGNSTIAPGVTFSLVGCVATLSRDAVTPVVPGSANVSVQVRDQPCAGGSTTYHVATPISFTLNY